MSQNGELVKLDEVSIFREEDLVIHLKAVTTFGDPVELNAHEAREIAHVLLRMADVLDPPSPTAPSR